MIPKDPKFTADEVARYLEQRFGTLYAMEWHAYAKKRFIDRASEKPPSTWWDQVRPETTMLSWEEAVKAMKDEGYEFSFVARSEEHTFSACHKDEPLIGGHYLFSDIADPTTALNDLLRQCRERWPATANEPWDGLTLEELIHHCTKIGYEVKFDQPGGKVRALMSNSNAVANYHSGKSERDALVSLMNAMKIKR